MRSDSVKNMSAYADQNHAPSLAAARLELITIDELIKQVSSPGGTTIAGLDKLYEGKLTDTVDECCKACTARAYELAKK